MLNIKRKFLFCLIVLTFCVFNSTQAVMIKLSLQDLTNAADTIVLGEVKNIQFEWSMDKSVILTVVTLKIHEVWKGDYYNDQILIQFPGGIIDDMGLKVSDMPIFQEKERVLVFLKSIMNINETKNSSTVSLGLFPAFSVFGYAQGKYSITENGVAYKDGYGLISKDPESDSILSLSSLKAGIYSILQKDSKEKNS